MKHLPAVAVLFCTSCLYASAAKAQPPVTDRRQTLPAVSFGLVAVRNEPAQFHNLGVTTRILLARHLFLDGEFLHTDYTERQGDAVSQIQTSHDSFRTSAGLLYRSSPAVATWWVGGGVQFVHWDYREDWQLGDIGGSDFDTDRTVAGYGEAGVEWHLASRLSVFASGRASSFSREHVSFQVGMRFVAIQVPLPEPDGRRAREATPSRRADNTTGDHVDVLLLSGTKRSGVLIALTPDRVTLRVRPWLARDSTEVTYALSEVRRMARSAHTGRKAAFWAGVVTFAAVTVLSCGQGDEEDCWPEFGALLGGGAAAVGAVIGSRHDRKTLPARIIYPAPAASVQLRPTISARAQALALLIRW